MGYDDLYGKRIIAYFSRHSLGFRVTGVLKKEGSWSNPKENEDMVFEDVKVDFYHSSSYHYDCHTKGGTSEVRFKRSELIGICIPS